MNYNNNHTEVFPFTYIFDSHTYKNGKYIYNNRIPLMLPEPVHSRNILNVKNACIPTSKSFTLDENSNKFYIIINNNQYQAILPKKHYNNAQELVDTISTKLEYFNTSADAAVDLFNIALIDNHIKISVNEPNSLYLPTIVFKNDRLKYLLGIRVNSIEFTAKSMIFLSGYPIDLMKKRFAYVKLSGFENINGYNENIKTFSFIMSKDNITVDDQIKLRYSGNEKIQRILIEIFDDTDCTGLCGAAGDVCFDRPHVKTKF